MYEEVEWVSLEHLPTPIRSRTKMAVQVESVRKAPFQLALSALRECPKAVEHELSEWLGLQGSALATEVGMIEVFTGKAPLSAAYVKQRGLTSIRLRTAYGQDFSRARDRRLLLLLIGRCHPKDIWLSWPCSCWSGWA